MKNEPRLGLIDPKKPTSVIKLKLDEDVNEFINKVSELSNHTVSSVITVLLAVQLIKFDEEGLCPASTKSVASTVKKGKISGVKLKSGTSQRNTPARSSKK
jgi:hypothetical protein